MNNLTSGVSHLLCIALLVVSIASASAQSVREHMDRESDFRIYSVIFGITVTTESTTPRIRLARVTDPISGTADAVNVDVPDDYVQAAKKKIEAKRYAPKLEDGFPVEFFTYFYYVPGYPNIVVVDLDKPLSEQP